MSGSDRLEAFRLALSYLERVEGELAKWDRLRATNQLDRTRFDSVKARYQAHHRKARRIVEAFRADVQQELPVLEHSLRQLRRTQKKLVAAAAGGEVDAQKINEQNRRLTQQIHDAEQRLAEAQLIAGAASPDVLGGHVELPLEEYEKQIGPPPETSAVRRTLSPLQLNLLTGALMLALVLGTVLLIARTRVVVRAEFSAAAIEGDPNLVRLDCRNLGNRPILFYAPWPSGRSRAPAGASGRNRSYGVLLYVREVNSRDFQLLEDATGLWKYRGREVENGGPIEIRPRSTAAVFLDLTGLQARGLFVNDVAIEFSRNGGAERQRYEQDLEIS